MIFALITIMNSIQMNDPHILKVHYVIDYLHVHVHV